MLKRPGVRFISTLRIAVVGSGPSGFYAATDLLKRNAQVTMFEKLPTPFGLSRYGVAPDHMEVKHCEETFSEAAKSERFTFRGNCEVGRDVSLKELTQAFNGVVLAYGCDHGQTLGIEGEDQPGVINAHEFVGWYNGNPETESIEPPLDQAKNVVIVGNGNVAMDIARLLLMPVDEIEHSDITQRAVEMLRKSTVNNVKIVARRGVLESAFATKEVRELLQLEKHGVKFEGVDEEIIQPYIPIKNKLERVIKRKLDTLLEYMQPIELRKGKKKYQIPEEYTKSWKLEYLKSPISITQNTSSPQLTSEITLQRNQIYHDSPDSPAKVKPIPNAFETIPADLVITSLGFRSTPMPGLTDLNVEFRNGVIPSRDCRVLDKDGKEVTGVYVTGWIKNAKKGPILNTLVDASAVSATILSDFEQGVISQDKKGVDALKLPKAINWEDWNTLNQFELEFGQVMEKARWKVPQVEKMLEIIKDKGTKEEKITKFKEYLVSYK